MAKMLKPTHSFIKKAIDKVSTATTGRPQFKYKKREDIHCGKTGMDIPNYDIASLSSQLVAAHSGPDGGLASLKLGKSEIDETMDVPFSHRRRGSGLASIHSNWAEKTTFGYGIATSLYDVHPVTGEMTGEPVADVFGICARENNCILALADGVNWGERAACAARAAVYGAMDYLNKELFVEGRNPENTQECVPAAVKVGASTSAQARRSS
ncbi:PREDICTED: PP2C-like domain-containing protein CG9801 [Priapulus caudatus]|uniref:PP2C-like domain-containing protein CG9801 n=1 Tax=Priapulus caudatus TaxID=37621 RepID=A0ABM1DT36_PRICU|nr:PREDICTED: PP2C-like domain-containing protein CG9801 [Priapulus caudatus]